MRVSLLVWIKTSLTLCNVVNFIISGPKLLQLPGPQGLTNPARHTPRGVFHVQRRRRLLTRRGAAFEVPDETDGAFKVLFLGFFNLAFS